MIGSFLPICIEKITRKDSIQAKWRREIVVGQDCEIIIIDDTINHNLY